MFSTQTPRLCTHIRVVGQDCEACDERVNVARWFALHCAPTDVDDNQTHDVRFVPRQKVHQHRGHAEQIGRYGSPKARKFEKQRANRLRRRAEKLDPVNAPTRLIRGWND